MTGPLIVLDDGIAVPDAIARRIGVPRFGDLLHQRRPLRARLQQILDDARYDEPILLTTRQDRHALVRRLRDREGDRRVVYWTADLLAMDPTHLRRTLDKLGWSDLDVVVRPPSAPLSSALASLPGRRVAALLETGRDPTDRERWWRDAQEPTERLPDDDALLCLSDPDTFSRWLSGALDTRAFNALHAEGRVLRKHSADVGKMRREHGWYALLPESLKRFAVPPFGFAEDDAGASYQMERLRIPDAAIQWVHGPAGLPDEAADDLLDAVFDWLTTRPTRHDPAAAQALATRYYRTKTHERTEAFLATEVGAQVDGLLRSGGFPEGLSGVVARLDTHLDAAFAASPPTHVAVMHGDLCLSNILFDKATGLTRFIDPRGATTEDDLWGPPTYDVAKLSHSLLGGYDFINQGLYDVVVGTDLRAAVRLDTTPRPAIADRFAARTKALGIDRPALRTFEAALFLSMLPLHAEDPRKTLAFALRGAAILDGLDAGDPLR